MEMAEILEFARKAVNAENASESVKLSAPDPDWFKRFVDEVLSKLDFELHDDGAECPCCGIPT